MKIESVNRDEILAEIVSIHFALISHVLTHFIKDSVNECLSGNVFPIKWIKIHIYLLPDNRNDLISFMYKNTSQNFQTLACFVCMHNALSDLHEI